MQNEMLWPLPAYLALMQPVRQGNPQDSKGAEEHTQFVLRWGPDRAQGNSSRSGSLLLVGSDPVFLRLAYPYPVPDSLKSSYSLLLCLYGTQLQTV